MRKQLLGVILAVLRLRRSRARASSQRIWPATGSLLSSYTARRITIE